MARSILHVDLDAFFVSAEQAREPSLRGKAVIVGGNPDGRGVVATASYEARVFGVRSGMPLRTAKRLAPDATFVRGDFDLYADLSRHFHAILRDYSPLVESGGLDEAYIDVTGCEAIVGTPSEAAASIRRRVRVELDLPVSVGIAATKVVAKVASDRAKPDGVCEVPAGTEAAFLAPLPLRDLPLLGPSMEARLVQLGVTTLGQLAALPAASLEATFGKHGRFAALRAAGIDPSRVAGGPGEAKSMSREGTFASDVSEPAHLLAVLRGFSESVGAQLRRHGRRARTVTVKVRFEDFSTVSRSVTLDSPANSDDALFAAAAALFEAVRARDHRPVRLIGVGASNLVPDAVQLSLDATAARSQDALSEAVDRVRRKYGRKVIQTGRTAFDRVTGGAAWRHERSLGLSSQIEPTAHD
jgi:DNA polymerase-4